MFLDDELYNIAYKGWNTEPKDLLAIKMDMIQTVIHRILKEHRKLVDEKSGTDMDLFRCIKRCQTHWYNALRKLEKEGMVIFGPKEFRSFEIIVSHHPLFTGFSDRILAYIK